MSRPAPHIEGQGLCGAPGQACCRWPNAPGAADPRYCNAGAGCDIGSNTCVAPCGAAGQVCCDGHDTRAPQWTPDGKMLSPTGPTIREMCDDGACATASRRCDAACGKTLGGPCCAPDAAVAVASCKSNELVCEFNDASMMQGTCIACGTQGKPACPIGGCRDLTFGTSITSRSTDRNGTCVPCGHLGGPACDTPPRCIGDSAPNPPRVTCIPAGTEGLQCLEGGACSTIGLFCDEANVCRACGALAQQCCPDQQGLDPGKRLTPCWEGTCGLVSGRRICRDDSVVIPGPGVPPTPPSQNEPRTCGGQPMGIGFTTSIGVWIRGDMGCLDHQHAFLANSFSEAVQCAHAAFPGHVEEAQATQAFRIATTGPNGCRNFTITDKDLESAMACADAQCGEDCESEEGECP